MHVFKLKGLKGKNSQY